MIIRVLLISLFCLVSIGAFMAYSSIQGREYDDRVNGIYDPAISDQQVADFIVAMKRAIEQENPFSSLVYFPCRFNTEGKSVVLNNTAEFDQYNKRILTAKLRNIIKQSSLEEVFVNSEGFMIGDGAIWFIPGKGIIAFNDI